MLYTGVHISLSSLATVLFFVLMYVGWRKIFRGFFNHPVFNALITVLLIIVGLYSSIYSVQIGNSLKYSVPCVEKLDKKTCTIQSTIHGAVASFWGSENNRIGNFSEVDWSDFIDKNSDIISFLTLLFITVALWLLSALAARGITADAQKDLIESSQQLEKRLRTLPPDNYLEMYDQNFRDAQSVYSYFQENPRATADEIAHGIRIILSLILELCQEYEKEKSNDVRYAANIMTYEDVKQIKRADRRTRSSTRRKLVFVDDSFIKKGIVVESYLDNLQGILTLQKKLSTTSSLDNPFAEDRAVSEIALAIPLVTKNAAGKYLLQPGAPLAFVTTKLNKHDDTNDLIAWMNSYGDFTPSLIKKVQNYFASNLGANVRSFISIPLSFYLKNCQAVLNIHKNSVGLLDQDNQTKFFMYLIPPFLNYLGAMTEMWEKRK